MEKNYAIIENNIVTNIIVAEQDFIDSHYPGAVRIDNLSTKPSIGWKYENNQFNKLEEIADILSLPSKQTVFTRLEFRQKFTLQELIKIDNYEQQNLTDVQKQTLKVITNNFAMATNIDLSDPLTIQGINYLVEVGFLSPERLAEILG